MLVHTGTDMHSQEGAPSNRCCGNKLVQVPLCALSVARKGLFAVSLSALEVTACNTKGNSRTASLQWSYNSLHSPIMSEGEKRIADGKREMQSTCSRASTHWHGWLLRRVRRVIPSGYGPSQHQLRLVHHAQ